MSNIESIKGKLKAYAKNASLTFQEVLTYYGLERTIFRISTSSYSQNFTLKGGIFLYAIFDKDYKRATTDADLLADRISNTSLSMREVFKDILSQKCTDGIDYNLDTLRIEDISGLKKYHGLNVKVIAMLGNIRIPINLDIGFGDIVTPDKVKMEFPIIIDNEQPIIYAYSIETVIAEKIEAIVKNGFLNSRYKDYYDVYVLIHRFNVPYQSMHEALDNTFVNRNTIMDFNNVLYNDVFINDKLHQMRWNSFLKKKKTLEHFSLETAVLAIRNFCNALFTGDNNKFIWSAQTQQWMNK